MQKSFNITVYGKVQGVFFRKHTKERAGKFQIKGFVCNQSDGCVYVEAEGEEDSVNKFIELMRKGPEKAFVEKIEIKEQALKGFTIFEIIKC